MHSLVIMATLVTLPCISGFELTFQKCIVKTFCRNIGGNGATDPRLEHLRKIGVTCAKNMHNIRVTYVKNMRKIRVQNLHHDCISFLCFFASHTLKSASQFANRDTLIQTLHMGQSSTVHYLCFNFMKLLR